jgi:hypothetical protein
MSKHCIGGRKFFAEPVGQSLWPDFVGVCDPKAFHQGQDGPSDPSKQRRSAAIVWAEKGLYAHHPNGLQTRL